MSLLEIALAEFKIGTLSAITSEKELTEMVDHFITGAPASYGKNHYDLSKETGIKYTKWESFLKNSKIALFKQEQVASVMNIGATDALLNLGNAQASVDIQKAKQFSEILKKDKQFEFKPFKIYAMPAEAKKFKDALLSIKDELETSEPSLEAVWGILLSVGVNHSN